MSILLIELMQFFWLVFGGIYLSSWRISYFLAC